jgi:hypothetical protein
MGMSAIVEAQPPKASVSSTTTAGIPALLPPFIVIFMPTVYATTTNAEKFIRTATRQQPNAIETINVWRTDAGLHPQYDKTKFIVAVQHMESCDIPRTVPSSPGVVTYRRPPEMKLLPDHE